jgi:hypothetical protein
MLLGAALLPYAATWRVCRTVHRSPYTLAVTTLSTEKRLFFGPLQAIVIVDAGRLWAEA